jgi:hypothetical protein
MAMNEGDRRRTDDLNLLLFFLNFQTAAAGRERRNGAGAGIEFFD